MENAENQWPHKYAIAVNPREKKRLVWLGGGALFLACLYFIPGQITGYLAKRADASYLTPRMTDLAKEGKPAAAAWLLEHDYKTASKTDFALIKAAAESGDPKSMYMYGVVVMAVQKDASTGKTWIRRAAAEGYPDAMLYIGKME